MTSWTAAHHAPLPFTISQSLLKFMSIELVMPSNHLILCCPFSFCPQSFPVPRYFPMSGLVSSVANYWSFSFSISPSNEYSGLISFRIDWFHLFAVQGTLKSLLQHHSSKASIFWCSAFFIAQLSHPYMTTGKTTGMCYCFPKTTATTKLFPCVTFRTNSQLAPVAFPTFSSTVCPHLLVSSHAEFTLYVMSSNS